MGIFILYIQNQMGAVEGKCKVDADCYATKGGAGTATEKTDTCCAIYTVTKVDSAKTGHADMITYLKSKFLPYEDGKTLKACDNGLRKEAKLTTSTTIKDNKTLDTSAYGKAGFSFTAYCDGASKLAALGSITAVTGVVYSSLL